MRVLMLNSTYHVGGAERILQLIALQLRSRFDVHVCALYEPGTVGEQMAEQGLPVHALYGTSRADLRVLPRFVRLLRQIRPHVLLTVDSPHAMVYAVIAKRLRLVPRLIIAVHSFGKLQRDRQMAIARRMASGVTDVLIALSEKHRRFLIEEEKWQAQEVTVIPNGVDLGYFTPGGEHLREEWGLASDTPTYGIVAALRPEKNHKRFLRVARRIEDVLPHARGFVIGGGALMQELQTEAKRLGLNVTFTGPLYNIPAVWRTLQVAVLTSDSVVETLPMTLIEAAACGVPAVSTDVGAVRDIVLDGETGFVVPVDDEALLAERILYLLQHPDKRKRMGERARQHAEAHFDQQKMVDRYAQVLSL
ncbi:MAG: glycosyltransferase [Armatimonadota bacterium]